MKTTLKRTSIGLAAAVSTLAIGGVAYAASTTTPAQQSAAVVADAATRLGVDSTKLDTALRQALSDQVDAQVKAGKLTSSQAADMKARIMSADSPILGGPIGRGGDHRGGRMPVPAMASYLGLTEANVQSALQSGKTPASLATANGKSVAGLVAALVADAKTHITADVTAGRITVARQTEMLSDLTQHVTDLVNGTAPTGGPLQGGPVDLAPAIG